MNDSQVKQLHTQVDQLVNDETIDTKKLLELMSRRAIGVAGNLMLSADDESVKLRAAQDFMDRGAETSKIQKHQIESWSLSGKDAKGLAEAMVESARVRQQYANLATEDFIRLEKPKDEAHIYAQAGKPEITKGVIESEAALGTHAKGHDQEVLRTNSD